MNAREIRMGKRDPAALAREAEYQDELLTGTPNPRSSPVRGR